MGRDVQTQFVQKQDALLAKVYKDSGIGSQFDEKSVQTDRYSVVQRIPGRHRSPLLSFLRRKETEVITQLQRNLKSRVEKAYQVEWKTLTEKIDLVSRLQADTNEADIECTKVDWNCDGSLVAVAFGNSRHDGLCIHKASLRVWKVLVGRLKKDPEQVIELPACATAISFHPRRKALLAAAIITGELFVWDVSPSPSGAVVIGNSPGLLTASGHSEVITALRWVSLTSPARTFMLLSSGLDGRLIIWKNNAPATRNGQLPGVAQQALIVPSKTMMVQNQEALQKSEWINRQQSIIGVTVMHTFPEGSQQTCLVGTDTGAIGSCNFQNFKDIGSPLDAVVLLSHNLGYKSHNGPVTSISRSPFLDSCFLTTSTDGKIRVYRMLKWEPLLEINMEEGQRATCSDWSPVRPSVFAVGTSSGNLLFHDVLSAQSGMRAATSIKVFPSAILSLKFNRNNSDLIAVTGIEESGVWKVPEILSEPGLDERDNFTKFVYQREAN